MYVCKRNVYHIPVVLWYAVPMLTACRHCWALPVLSCIPS